MAKIKHIRRNTKALGGKKKKPNKSASRNLTGKKPAKSRKVLVVKKKPRPARQKRQKKTIIKKVVKTAIKKTTVIKKIVRHKSKPAHKAKKRAIKTPVSEFAAESLFKARIKVIGIGGGGGSIVSEIGRSLEKATFVIADTDIRALKKKSGIKYFWFGEDLTHGLGTGVNIDLAKQAAESCKDKIGSIFKDQDIVIFIASLGGGLGSGATEIFAKAAKQFGGITFGIFTLPFKFEGKNKQRIALSALKTLRQSLNVSLVIPNEKIFKIIDANIPITQAFSVVNKSLIESLESLIDLIYNPGIINIDFADFRAILKGIGNTAFLNTIEESGKDRADKICQKILVNPLLQSSNIEAEKILFNISGSENLSMFEVEKISKKVAEENPKAKIIFGISKNPKLKNKIKTTILMTGGQISDEEPVILPEPGAEPALAQDAKENSTEDKKELKAKPEPRQAEKPKLKNKKPEKKKKTKPKAVKKPAAKKPEKKNKKQEAGDREDVLAFPVVPVFQVPAAPVHAVEQRKMSIVETSSSLSKKTIRRSALEIKKAEELQEKKRLEQEKEWEIPAFLRRVKFKS